MRASGVLPGGAARAAPASAESALAPNVSPRSASVSLTGRGPVRSRFFRLAEAVHQMNSRPQGWYGGPRSILVADTIHDATDQGLAGPDAGEVVGEAMTARGGRPAAESSRRALDVRSPSWGHRATHAISRTVPAPWSCDRGGTHPGGRGHPRRGRRICSGHRLPRLAMAVPWPPGSAVIHPQPDPPVSSRSGSDRGEQSVSTLAP